MSLGEGNPAVSSWRQRQSVTALIPNFARNFGPEMSSIDSDRVVLLDQPSDAARLRFFLDIPTSLIRTVLHRYESV